MDQVMGAMSIGVGQSSTGILLYLSIIIPSMIIHPSTTHYIITANDSSTVN
jgi:hypothetical protein